jgi:hypothetical protein
MQGFLIGYNTKAKAVLMVGGIDLKVKKKAMDKNIE